MRDVSGSSLSVEGFPSRWESVRFCHIDASIRGWQGLPSGIMNQEEMQQAIRDQVLVPSDDRVKIDSSNMRIDPTMTQKEATYQVILDIIKNTMVNDEIKNSESYQTYLALSTGTKPLKKGKATELAISMSKTEAEIADKEQRFHETHDSIVISGEQASRVDKEAVERQKKKKMKGIATDVIAQELLNLKNKVPDEPKIKSKGSNEGAETESRKETAKSEKADDKMVDEEEGNLDDEVHTEEDEKTDDEAHDDEYVHDDVEKHDDANDEMDNAEMMMKLKKIKKWLMLESVLISVIQNKKTELPPYTSSLSLSSDYGNQFLNLSFDVSLVAPLLDVLVSVIPKQTTPTPLTIPLSTPPTSSEAPNITTTVDHSEAIEESVQDNIINEVKNQLPKFLPKAVFDFVNLRIEKIVRDVLQKNPAFLAQSSFTLVQPHSDLYNGILNSIMLDEAIASGDVNPDKVLRKRDRGDDQDPTTRSDQGKKKRRQEKYFEPSKDKVQTSSPRKQPPRPLTLDPEWNKDKNINDGPEHIWFNDLVNAEKDPFTFDELMATPIDFSKFTMNRIKLDKITKADLVARSTSYSREPKKAALN
nr:hypothetical protein [Tanacetum cinerariifolium]